jgi:glutathione S-transferase
MYAQAHFIVSQLIKHWYGLLSAQEPEAQEAQRKDLLSAIQAISTVYSRTSGPYFLGERFSSADILVWPWIARLSVNAHYRGHSVPETPEFAAYHAFVAAMKTRPAVAKTQKEDAYYVEGYNVYASGSRVPK